MSALENLQSVQFVTAQGKRFAVLSVEDWEALIEWLETIEDNELAHEAYEQLTAAGSDRVGAGWVAWDDIRDEIG